LTIASTYGSYCISSSKNWYIVGSTYIAVITTVWDLFNLSLANSMAYGLFIIADITTFLLSYISRVAYLRANPFF